MLIWIVVYYSVFHPFSNSKSILNTANQSQQKAAQANAYNSAYQGLVTDVNNIHGVLSAANPSPMGLSDDCQALQQDVSTAMSSTTSPDQQLSQSFQNVVGLMAN